MNKRKFCEAEERRLNWLINFKLPNYWKKIGWSLLLVSLVLTLSTKLLDGRFRFANKHFEKGNAYWSFDCYNFKRKNRR